MRKERILLIAGILIVILPYLGIPDFFRSLLISILGLVVFFVGYRFHFIASNKMKNDDSIMKPFLDSQNIV
ncbi:MAG: hypothetical protein NTX85_03140 [Candidatus Nomurabacteria bacterium]|nr:hypothetical protein [Candidatus Nomurabacteria bacterium]